MDADLMTTTTTTTTTAPADAAASVSVLLLTKIGAMFALGCGSLVAGMMPVIVKKCKRRAFDRKHGIASTSSISTSTSGSTMDAPPPQGLLTSLLLCFGGGVLLFTTFLHLAPEIRESVERHQANGQLATLGSLSLAELLFCGGFFFVYLVEETVHALLTPSKHESEALLYRTISVRRCNHPSNSNSNNNNNNNNNNNSNHNNNNNNNSSSGEASSSNSATGLKCQAGPEKRAKCSPSDDPDLLAKAKALPAIFILASSSEVASEVTKCDSKYDLESLSKKKINAAHSHSHINAENSIRGLLTVLALSFHAIFEGLAVGLEPALSSVVYLAAAIATHKLVISFCVGMELYCAKASAKTIFGYLSVFSLVTPLGIIIGVALGHLKNDSNTLGPTPTILQGMAAGTLLYVVFFEVLAREKANDKSGLLQLLAILIGFMLMLGLQIATAHSHEHGGHSHDSHHNEDNHDEAAHNHDHTLTITTLVDGASTALYDYVTSTNVPT